MTSIRPRRVAKAASFATGGLHACGRAQGPWGNSDHLASPTVALAAKPFVAPPEKVGVIAAICAEVLFPKTLSGPSEILWKFDG
jgi:hypothetical protein